MPDNLSVLLGNEPLAKQPPWLDEAMQEGWGKAQKVIRAEKTVDSFSKYRYDPVGFGQELLGEYYTDDMVKVAESVRDNVITIARSGNGLGKSFCAARIAIWWFSVFKDSKVYITAAPPVDNLEQILWGEISNVVRKKPTLFTSCLVKKLFIRRTPKHFIAGVAIPMSGTSADREAKFSGKHAPYLLFIVDEGDAVPDEVYRGIEGCMSGGDLVRLLIMFNPKARSGEVYQKELKHQANVIHLSAFNHPNVVQGINIIPGAVSRETTLRRINTWSRPLVENERVDAECFEVPEYLIGESVVGLDGKFYPPMLPGIRKITDPAFSYMVLGEFPAHGEQQLISDIWIDNARSRWDAYISKHGEIPPAGVQPIMGLDMAEFGTDANIAMFRYGGFVSKPVMWSGVDPDESANRATRLYFDRNARIVMVDGTGIGAGVAPAMTRRGRESGATGDKALHAISVKVGEKPSPIVKSPEQGEFQLLKDQIWWSLREWLRIDEGAMLPPDPMLIEELKAVTYEVTNHGKLRVTPKDKMREMLKRSPDRADALALTFSPFERAKWVRLTNE